MFDEVPIPSQESRFFLQDRPQGDLFWEIDVVGSEIHVRSGNDGGLGRSKTTSFDSAEAAQKKADKDIAKKISDGFEEQTGESAWVRGLGKKPLLLRLPKSTTELYYNARFPPQSQIDFSAFAALPKLTTLSISEHKLEDVDLAELAGCKKLTELDLDIGVKEIDLEGLSGCTHLKDFELRTRAKTTELGGLAKCKKLESIKLFGLKETTVDLSCFVDLKNLTQLGLMDCAFKKLDLSALANCKKLQSLHLQYNAKLASIDMTPLHKHKNLKVVTVSEGCHLEGEAGLSAEVRRFG